MSLEKAEILTKKIAANREKRFGLILDEHDDKVSVIAIELDSLAEEYGLKVHDHILSVNGEKVRNKEHCEDMIDQAYDMKKDVELKFERPSDEHEEDHDEHEHPGEESKERGIRSPAEPSSPAEPADAKLVKVTVKHRDTKSVTRSVTATANQTQDQPATDKAKQKAVETELVNAIMKEFENADKSKTTEMVQEKPIGTSPAKTVESLGVNQIVKPPESKPPQKVEVTQLGIQTAPQKPNSESQKEKIVDILDLDFQSTPKPPKVKAKPAPAGPSHISFINESEFEMGNPLDGIPFPAPADVRAILTKRIPEIIADYSRIEQPPPAVVKLTPPKEIQFESAPQEQGIGSDYPPTKVFRSSRKSKKKKK